MTKRPLIRFIFAAAASICLCLSCVTLTGGGTEGGNVITGLVLNEQGSAAGNVAMTLVPADFNPLTADTGPLASDTTDGKGRFRFRQVQPGAYNLQGLKLDERTRLLRRDIVITEDSLAIPADTVRRTGAVKVVVPQNIDTINGYLYVPGTTIMAPLFSGTGLLVLDSLPAGNLPAIYYAVKNSQLRPMVIKDSLTVVPEDTVSVAFAGWRYKTVLRLNTSATGADVSGNVYQFPVLIRLTSSNFNFNEARGDGADIRFSKPDMTPLPYEIERWDSAAARAELWVKADTILGSNDSQAIIMYWANPSASSQSGGTGVFRPDQGFRGVWHLAEEADGTGEKGLYKDATGRNNGDDYVSGIDRSGMIGNGCGFDGTDDFIPTNAAVTTFVRARLTVSLWVRLNGNGGTLLSKLDADTVWEPGEECLYFGDGSNMILDINGRRPSFVGHTNDYNIASAEVPPYEWHHLAYTWDWDGASGGNAKYYIDGSPVNLSTSSFVTQYNDGTGTTVLIGRHNYNESHANFNGSMDELEISSEVRSAAWIKLSYMNQRPNDALVVFKAR